MLTISSGVTLTTNKKITIEKDGTLYILGSVVGSNSSDEFKIEEKGDLIITSVESMDWEGKAPFETKSDADIDGVIRIGDDFTLKEKVDIIGNGRIDVEGSFDNEKSSSSIFGCTLTGSGCCGCGDCCLGSAAVGPLPVTLVDFVAKLMDESVKLEWKTASELNNDYL